MGNSVQLVFNTNTSVVWSLDDPSIGSVSPNGLYMAPDSVESPQTDTVRATSSADPTKQVVFVIKVNPRASISPEQATVFAGEALQFAANLAVGWMVVPGVGSIDDQGVYRAPMHLATTQTVQIVAASVDDTSNIAISELIVRPEPVVLVPASVTLTSGQSLQFSANIDVAWALMPTVGTVDGAGLYTAPREGLVAQSVMLTAVSLSDATNFATAPIQLIPPLALGPELVELLPTLSQRFVASDAVNWTLSPQFGSIDGNGLYTAPPDGIAGQIVSVVATRAAEPLDSAVATVTLAAPEVQPSQVSLGSNSTFQFATNIPAPIAWSLLPNLGTITADGFFTAPGFISDGAGIVVKVSSTITPALTANALVQMVILKVPQPAITDTNCDELAAMLSAAGMPPQPWEEPVRKVGNGCRLFSPGPARRIIP